MSVLSIAAVPVGGQQSSTGAQLPDAGDVVAAYLTLRSWTDTLEPPRLEQPAAQLPLSGSTGVAVTLRRFGRVVGSATAVGGEVNLQARWALGRALADALGDPAIASLPDDLRSEVGRGLVLELEVAGTLEPMLARSWRRMAGELDPGLDGVAMRHGDRWAMLFPSQMLASNLAGSVAARLPGLAAELGLPVADLRRLIEQRNVSVYRFRTLHLAQADPKAFPFETTRGDHLVPNSAVSTGGIATFADRLAEHLLNKILDGDAAQGSSPAIGLLGDYLPVSDTYRPPAAPPLDQALVSLALGRYAASPHVDQSVALQARRQAGRLLHDLADRYSAEDAPLENAAVAAAVVHAVDTYRRVSGSDATIDQLDALASQRIVNAGSDAKGHALAMVAAAAARLLHRPEPPLDAPAVRELLDAAWQSVPEHEHVAMLPWIGWAELDYAASTDEPLARVDELRLIREVLDASRVSGGDGAAPDLVGGFALVDGQSARPTAQSTRPAVFLATMLGVAELTSPEEAPAALGRHLHTMRFLMQLSAREESLWSMRNPKRARGGIRAAPWDSDMPNPAQAMALLAAVETLEQLR